MKNNITQDLLKAIEETVVSCEVELYDAEFKGNHLRILITKPAREAGAIRNAVSLDDCVAISQKLSQRFDMENLIPTRYFLEVSSPGIERKLRNKKDFEASIGQTVSIRAKAGSIIGKLLSVSEIGINIINVPGSSLKEGTEQFITYNDINFARIIISNEELFQALRSKKSKDKVSQLKTQKNINHRDTAELVQSVECKVKNAPGIELVPSVKCKVDSSHSAHSTRHSALLSKHSALAPSPVEKEAKLAEE